MIPHDPMVLAEAWLDAAREARDPVGTAAVLATADASGRPSARVVLVKGIEEGEVVFGTQLDTRKGREIAARPEVALVLSWPSLGRQLRVDGEARVASREESERVWASRGRDGRLVDVVSEQGAPLEDPGALRGAFDAADARWGEDIPRPEDWAAVRVRPRALELWEEGERNLAVRTLHVLSDGGWSVTRLQP